MTDRYAHLADQLNGLVQARELAIVEHAAKEVTRRSIETTLAAEVARASMRMFTSAMRSLSQEAFEMLPPPPVQQPEPPAIPEQQYYPRVSNGRY